MEWRFQKRKKVGERRLGRERVTMKLAKSEETPNIIVVPIPADIKINASRNTITCNQQGQAVSLRTRYAAAFSQKSTAMGW